MAARLWTALLLLAAVFTMHGLQCTSAADDGAVRLSAPAHSVTAALASGHARRDPRVAPSSAGPGPARAAAGDQ